MSDIRYWIALSMVPEVGPVRARKLISVFKEPERVFSADTEELISQAEMSRERCKKHTGLFIVEHSGTICGRTGAERHEGHQFARPFISGNAQRDNGCAGCGIYEGRPPAAGQIRRRRCRIAQNDLLRRGRLRSGFPESWRLWV